MDSKAQVQEQKPQEQKPQEQKPQEQKPQEQKKSNTACNTQVKDYEQCLQSFSYYFTSCKKQQIELTKCSEFNKWIENSVRSNLK